MRTLVLLPLAASLMALSARQALAGEPLAVEAAKSADAIEFSIGGKVLAKYRFEASLPKPCFFPVLAPCGQPVTRAFPLLKGEKDEASSDHIHHKSLWFCHGDVIPEGIDLKVRSADKKVVGVDFWSEAANHGKMICVKVGEIKEISKIHRLVPTTNEWRTPDDVKILDEQRIIEVRSLERGYLIILKIDLHASICPITFGDTKEGSFGVRVHDALRASIKDGGSITAASGESVSPPAKDNITIWGKPSDWHDYSGRVGGHTVGLTMMDDPANSSRALWHTRAYGLMAANPFAREKSGFPGAKGNSELLKLKKGEHLKLRYAVYIHDGDAKSADVAEAFKIFTGTPQ